MSGASPAPPRWAERLIRLVTPRDDVEYLLSDLSDRFEALSVTEGVGPARRWYRSQALRSLLAAPGHVVDQGASGLGSDVRIAGRVLRRRPLYTLGILGTLALGLGSLVVVGSIAWSVWLAPFPFPDPDRVVRVYEVDRQGAQQGAGVEAGRSRVSPPLLEDLRAHDWRTVRAVAGVSGNVFDWNRGDESMRLQSVTVSPEAFDILGIRVVLGRVLSDDADAAEVVLTESFWERAFGRDPGVVDGTILTLNGRDHRVVGVVAERPPYPRAGDLYTSIQWSEDDLSTGMRGARFLDVVARVDPAHTVVDAAAEIDRFIEGLGAQYSFYDGWGGTAVVLSRELLAPYRGVLALLLAAGALFLMLALTNVVGLVTARTVRDQRTRAVRLALGASEARLLRASALEGGIVGLFAGLLATGGAALLMVPVRALVPAGTPRAEAIGVSPSLVGFALVVAIVGGVGVGAVGYALARGRGASALLSGERTTAGSRGRAVVVVGQFALTTLLGIGGVVVLNEMSTLRSTDLGFEPAGTVAAQVILSGERHPTPEARRVFWADLMGRAEARGVSLAIGTNAPMSGMRMNWGFFPDPNADQSFAQYHIVSAGYFDRFEIDVLEGRAFSSDDRFDTAPVVVVNRRLVDEVFPGENVVGRDITVGSTLKTIVGVVESVRHFGPDQDAPLELYAPFEQDPWPHAQVLAAGDPAELAPLVRTVLSELDPAMEPPSVDRYDRYVDSWFQALRLQSIVVGLLAIVGTLLAGLGLYALVAYRVSARTREIGIRMALGASETRVFSSVVRGGTALAVLGAAVGAGVWLLLSPRFAAWMDSLDGAPIWVPVVVAGVVMIVSVLASAAPAARSVAIDPAVALRAEGG